MSSSIKPKIAHLILAAGKSDRMGRCKQLLPWRSTTLIGHAIEQSLHLDTVKTYVILGAYYNEIYNQIKVFPVEIIKNKDWQLGMGTSIRNGIIALQKDEESYDGVLISLVDQPLIDTNHYAGLINKYINSDKTIVATSNKDGVGVPVLLSKGYFNELRQLDSDYGARHILKKYTTEIYEVSLENKNIDIDTFEEYQLLIKDHFV
ncbi:nucleotidyltransferase family protein [Aquimarina sp. 2201CG1-2-11]|uniref:nucleotidyltransferase family protein n=1 Tax=Aquimarina discodermiae TaxID=3231043 RepID=UPI00346379C9